MARRRDGRLELVLLGGFLGAGKTNYLRHQLFLGHYARHYLLVNEAADVAVDDLLLRGGLGLQVLAGGCACCAGLDRLKRALIDICNRVDAGELPDLEGIFLETSGLASLPRIAQAITDDAVLSRRIVLGDHIVIVDAQHAAVQLAEEPLWLQQIEAASHLVITKAAAARDLARLWPTLRRINPDAGLSACEFGHDVALPVAAQPYDITAVSDNVPLEAHSITLGDAPDWATLSVWLSAIIAAHGARLHRVKGAIQTDAGTLLFQSVRNSVQAPEILPEIPDTSNRLVFIGRGYGQALLQQAWNDFAAIPEFSLADEDRRHD